MSAGPCPCPLVGAEGKHLCAALADLDRRRHAGEVLSAGEWGSALASACDARGCVDREDVLRFLRECIASQAPVRPACVDRDWAARASAAMARLEAGGNELVCTAVAALGRPRAVETFVSGAWLKQRLLAAGMPPAAAAARCREHGALVFAASLEPWKVALDILAEHGAAP